MAFKPLDDAPAGSVSFRPLDDTEATTPTAADYLKGAASGVGGLVSGIGYLAEAAGANQLGGSIRGIGDTTQRYWQDSMTPAGQRAAQSQVFDDDPGSALPKLGDRWGQALAMGAAQSAPSMLAAAIPGGIAAAGLRGAAGMAASRGIGGALAPLAAGTAAPIGGWATNLAGNLAARVPTALGFGAAEGAVAGASNAAQWKSDIEQKPLAELRNMPGFAALEAQIGEQAARQQIAEQGAADIMARTALATGGIGALTGGGALGSAFQRVTTGAKGGILGAIGRDAAKEAGQELLQSGGERAIQNIATRDYLDPSQSITQGVLADALSGGAIGGVMGGVTGGGSHLAKGPLQKAAEASAATTPPTTPLPDTQTAGIPAGNAGNAGNPAGNAGNPAGNAQPATDGPGAGSAAARADASVLDVARAAAEDFEAAAHTTSEGFRQTAEGLRKLSQQPNTPAAPGISPAPVSTAAPSLPTNQAEPAGVPVSQPQEGAVPRGNETEITKPAAPGQQAQPAKAADSAEAEREWRDFVASEGRDIGPRQLAVVRAQFMRRRLMNAGIEAATGRVEDARQREVAANRMAILEALPLTTAGNTIRRFAAALRDAGIRDFRVSPEERQLIARRIAARDTLQPLEQAPPNELAIPEKRAKQAQPTMPRIDALRRRAAMPGVRIVGNRMLDRHGKRLATLSDSEVSELLPKPQQQPARTVEDTELADFIQSESADLGKRRVTLRALQALRQQKQAEADKTDLEDLIEAERADLRERFARLQDAQAAAKAKKPFVIPPLTTPAQPTTTRVMEQQAADVPLGKHGKASAPASVREATTAQNQPQAAPEAAPEPKPSDTNPDKAASYEWAGATVLFTSPSGKPKRGSVIRVTNGKAVIVSSIGQHRVDLSSLKRSKSESTPLMGFPASDNSAGKVKSLEYARQELAYGTPHWYVANALADDIFGDNSKLTSTAFSYVLDADNTKLWRLIDSVARQLGDKAANNGEVRRATAEFVARQTQPEIAQNQQDAVSPNPVASAMYQEMSPDISADIPSDTGGDRKADQAATEDDQPQPTADRSEPRQPAAEQQPPATRREEAAVRPASLELRAFMDASEIVTNLQAKYDEVRSGRGYTQSKRNKWLQDLAAVERDLVAAKNVMSERHTALLGLPSKPAEKQAMSPDISADIPSDTGGDSKEKQASTAGLFPGASQEFLARIAKYEDGGEPVVIVRGSYYPEASYTLYEKGRRIHLARDWKGIQGEVSGSDPVRMAMRYRTEEDIVYASPAAKQQMADEAQAIADQKAKDKAEYDAREANAKTSAEARERLTRAIASSGAKFTKGSFTAKSKDGGDLQDVQGLIHGGLIVHKSLGHSIRGPQQYTISHIGLGISVLSGFKSQDAAKQAAVRLVMLADMGQLKTQDDIKKDAFRPVVRVGSAIKEAGGDPLAGAEIDFPADAVANAQKAAAPEVKQDAKKAAVKAAPAAPTEKPESSPDDIEKLQAARQLLADNIETKRLNRQTVPTAWTTKLAEIDAKIRGESDQEAVYSMVVEGHPMFDGSPILRNLIPIKVTSLADAERKLFAAQDLYSKLSGDRAKAKNALSVAKTAQQKKAAQKALQDLNNNGATEDAVNTLRQETLPELQRLVKAAEDKFGSAKPAPAPAAAPTEPTSNAGELPAAEASPDNTPASEPLENPEELPSADDRADKNTFSVQRITADDQIETVSFERGEYVKAYVADGKYHDGEISGISQAMRQFKIGDSDIWYPFGAAYKAEKPKGKDKKPAVPLSSVLESVNKKFGDGLTEEDRIPEESGKPTRPIVEHVTAKGKTLRGTIRTDLTLDQARALDKYTFRKDGGYFIREAPTAGAAAAPEAKDAAPVSKPDKSKQQAARLRSTGEKLIESAQEAMGRDRLTNTARRARMASGAEAKAAQDKLIGETMLRIADAIEDGNAESLAGITSRAQVEQLDSIMQVAIYRADDKAGGYALTQKNKGRPLADADLSFVAMPGSGQWISGARKGLIDGIAGKRGAPELRAEILRATGYTAEIHAKAKALLSDDEIKHAVGWSAVEGIERAARLARAGITNIDQLRKAIKEYAQIRAAKTEGNKAKALERALIGQKVGVDFFPTPSAVAADMVRRAGIKPGMRVLEPSAGNGNIAEAIQAAGVAPDVIEVSPSLREILDAKGFNLVGNDFMEASGQQYDRIVMNPPFSSRMDAEHVQHAYSLLKPGGKIVAIMGEGVFFGTDAKAVKFREWLDSVGGTSEKLPQGTFTDRTLMATTGTNSRLVEISKPDDVRFNIGTSPNSTPADRAIYSMAADGKPADEILSFITKASRRPFNRILAAALRRAGIVSSITLDTASRFGKQQGAARYAAAYNPTTDTVALFTYRDAERHVLHELVHAATMKAIAGKGPAAVRMRALFRHVQKSGSLDGQYGMTDVDEFVAEAFSNPRFQDALRGIPAPAGSALKSAWQWFVRIVARIVGIRTQPSETALDRALTVVAQLMRENAALAVRRGDGDTRYAIAWHGTPHVWPPEPGFPHGRPRLDKMGSGEGAQAYGWGWYSAESQGVAAAYKTAGWAPAKAVRFPDGRVLVGKQRSAIDASPESLAVEAIVRFGGDVKEAYNWLDDFGLDRDARKWIRRNVGGRNTLPVVAAPSSLYQLDIPDDVMPKLLDWDKLLSEQSPEVQNALLEAEIANRSGQDLLQMDPTGEAIVSALGRDEVASEYLASLGIPGLRYLDGSSRNKGEGTYNYVLWDQKVLDRIALLERNGERLDAIRAADEMRFSLDAGQQFDGPEVAATPLKPGTTTLMVDGTERPAMNSNGKPIHWSEEGVRNFWRWFSSSAVVDAQGRPLVVYHGTKGVFDVFDAKRQGQSDFGASGRGFYFSQDSGSANVYASLSSGDGSPNILPAYVNLMRPYELGAFIPQSETASLLLTNRVKTEGYDGVVVRGADGVLDEIVVFSPEQIKSATGNTGAFSPTDPDIRFNIATDWQQSPVAQEVAKAFKAAARSDAALSWLNPVQTQYHKAERLAQQGKFGFKRVFELGQKFLSDISRFAVMAENSAPTLFHQIRSLADAKQAAGAALRGDFGKQRNADVRAIAAPLYEGTLYGGGNPMAGMVWSDSQLRSRFGLTDRQIALYHEAREAVKVSMDEMAKSLIARHAKRENVAADTSGSLQDVAEVVRDTLTLRADVLADEAQAEHDDTMQQVKDLREAGGQDKRAADMQKEAEAKLESQQTEVARIRATVADVQAIADKAQKLQDAGYFPLMRFGRHTVTARDADGKVQHFSMHDGIPLVPRSGQAQANKLAAALREEHPDWDVTTGLMNPEKYKLYQGMNVDALQLFADHLDDETRQTYQDIIRLATNERSALRRMLKREGTPGFDRDVRRTLASFILSNARYTSSAYHLADMAKAAEQAEEDGGDVGAEAVKLYDYVTKPQEEAAKLRGFLFFNFLGGSIAAAMVNATQVPMMTFPRLAQYEDAGKLAARLARAAKMATGNPQDVAGEVGAALRRAEEDGITAPHQIYEMTATAANNIFAGSMGGSALLRAWGAPFAMAESFNRRTTFIAAWQIGSGMTANQLRDAGASTAFEFAEKMVQETQGIYNRGNRVNIGRGAIGATVMTFRQFSIMYLEMFSRLPPKQKAIMAGMLILAAGAGGLPFAEDIEDIIDTIGQWLGYRTNTRRTIRRGLSAIAGQRAADIAMNGVLSQVGVDLHSRLGLHNILPGSALLKPSTTDKGREFQDLLGPAASVVAAMGQALQDLATGRPDKAALAMAPVAIQNAAKGIAMANTGRATDMRGKPTIPVNLAEAGAKAVGLNPKSVADYGTIKRDSTQDDRLIDVTRERFTAAIVDAILADDPDARREALQDVVDWNKRNPDARIAINQAAVRKRVMDMRSEGPARVIKSLSPSLRQQARQEFADAQ